MHEAVVGVLVADHLDPGRPSRPRADAGVHRSSAPTMARVGLAWPTSNLEGLERTGQPRGRSRHRCGRPAAARPADWRARRAAQPVAGHSEHPVERHGPLEPPRARRLHREHPPMQNPTTCTMGRRAGRRRPPRPRGPRPRRSVPNRLTRSSGRQVPPGQARARPRLPPSRARRPAPGPARRRSGRGRRRRGAAPRPGSASARPRTRHLDLRAGRQRVRISEQRRPSGVAIEDARLSARRDRPSLIALGRGSRRRRRRRRGRRWWPA